MHIYSSHPAYFCPLLNFCRDFPDCCLPILTCIQTITCPFLNIYAYSNPITSVSDLCVLAPSDISDAQEMADIICCAKKSECCLSKIYSLNTTHITSAFVNYSGPLTGHICVDLRKCDVFMSDIQIPFFECF